MFFLDYLNSKAEEVQEKIYAEKRLQEEAVFELKENRRFIEMLEKEKVTPFTEFTPQVISMTEKKMQAELDEQNDILKKRKEQLDQSISGFEKELADINEAIKNAKEIIRNERSIRQEERKVLKEKISLVIREIMDSPANAKEQLEDIISNL